MTRLVCENHPDKAWPDECNCGPGMADPIEKMCRGIAAALGWDDADAITYWGRPAWELYRTSATAALKAYIEATGGNLAAPSDVVLNQPQEARTMSNVAPERMPEAPPATMAPEPVEPQAIVPMDEATDADQDEADDKPSKKSKGKK